MATIRQGRGNATQPQSKANRVVAHVSYLPGIVQYNRSPGR
jgi:hypothetical protein